MAAYSRLSHAYTCRSFTGSTFLSHCPVLLPDHRPMPPFSASRRLGSFTVSSTIHDLVSHSRPCFSFTILSLIREPVPHSRSCLSFTILSLIHDPASHSRTCPSFTILSLIHDPSLILLSFTISLLCDSTELKNSPFSTRWRKS